MKKAFLLILFSGIAFAQPEFSSISSSPGAFSRMGFGARGIGMGNSMSAVTEGNLVSYYNPALSAFQEKSSFQTSYSFLSLDRKLNFINFTHRFDFYDKADKNDENRVPKSSAGISIGIINAGVSNIDGRDGSGNPTGELSTGENQIFFAFSNKFSKKLALGIAIKYYRYKLYESLTSSGIGFDIGAIYTLNEQIHFSFVLTDINSKYKWDTTPLFGTNGSNTVDNFPLLKKIGISYKNTDYNFLVSAEFENSNEGTNILRIGAEYNIYDQLYLRGGIDQYNLSNTDFPARPSLGFSYFKMFGKLLIGVDYAFVVERYSPSDRHIIGLNFRF